jgi:hypothetical protein
MKNYYMVLGLLAVFILSSPACSKSNDGPNGREEESVEPDNIELATLGELSFAQVTTTGVVITGFITDQGGAHVRSRGVCWSTSPSPRVEDESAEAGSTKGSGEFSVQLSNLLPSTEYYVRAYARNAGGIAYSTDFSFRTTDVQSVEFATRPMFIIGSSLASYDVEVLSNGGGQITELGVCWGEEGLPTVDGSQKAVYGGTEVNMGGVYRINMANLSERRDYHLRAYAINETGVSYGSAIPFRTIGKGNMTYTFNRADNPTAEEQAAYDRLQVAIDSAVWYVNNYTSVTKHVWLNYDPRVPTADANNEGWMRFGASADFHNIRTMLHEMNHTVGTGTTSWWWNSAIRNGTYQFPEANQIIKYINGDAAVINGDSQHWWPYGLNQNSEVSSSWDYVYNCLIIEAMRRDGMTSHSGPYDR